MSYFNEKLKKRYLTIKRKAESPHPECPLELLECDNLEYLNNFEAPYVQCVRQYLDENGANDGYRLLLVTKNRNAALKTSILFANLQEQYEDDNDEWCSYGDYDDISSYGQVYHMDFSMYSCPDKKDATYRMAISIMNNSDIQDVIFTGVTNGISINSTIQAIACSTARNQYVLIKPEEMKLSAVQCLIYEYGFVVLELPELTQQYYSTVLYYLLKDTKYKMEETLNECNLLHRLQQKRGERLCEEDLAVLLDFGVKEAQREGRQGILCMYDFGMLLSVKKERTWDILRKMQGLREVKLIAEELVALLKERKLNERLQTSHNHMVFYGKPGTGKTTCAQLLSDVLAEEGFGNGNFVVATRKDLVGEYVGHTAPRVAKKFEEARGGILFVDEAGFFLQRESGGFVEEAVKEFVRYMEKETEVMVIFAMYPDEARSFMEMDTGLLSRIKYFVHFPDYSCEELLAIAESMFDKNGYKLARNCYQIIEKYIKDSMRRDKEKFGNARTVRNLMEMSISQISLRHFRESNKPAKQLITAEDIKGALVRLQGVDTNGTVNAYGFLGNNTENRTEKI